MSAFQVAVLASGSKGNATLVRGRSGMILIDMGISCLQVKKRMATLGLVPEDLSAIFITHEHIDHIKGLQTFTKRYDVPLFASAGTWYGIRHMLPGMDMEKCEGYTLGGVVEIDGMKINSFATSHDAREPLGFSVMENGSKFSYITDTGYISDPVRQSVEGSDFMVLEANHDITTLKNGSYPMYLKRRIAGVQGHLDNTMAADLLSRLSQVPEEVILAHLSEENNTAKLAFSTVNTILKEKRPESSIKIQVASQKNIVRCSDWGVCNEANVFEEIR